MGLLTNYISRFAALLISFAVIALVFILFTKDITTSSFQQDFEKLSSDFIKKDVEIYRNNYAIPHIVADNERDMYFAVGYVHAQDRLWQMDFRRRTALGELSEIFGIETLDVDLIMRAVDIRRICDSVLQNISPGTLSALQSYSNGINAFIQEYQARLPYEFDVLEYTPEQWEPLHTLAVFKLFAFEMSNGFQNDLIFTELAEKLNISYAVELKPNVSLEAPFIFDDKPYLPSDESADTNFFLKYLSYLPDSHDFNILAVSIDNIYEMLGISNLAGSNAWVIKKHSYDSVRNYAIIANDTHHGLKLPTIWYQVHMTAPGLNVIGYTLPGVPFVVAGRNDNISWGICNAMLDDCDYFFDPVSGNVSDSSRMDKFDFRRDTIRIKDIENYEYYQRFSDRSNVFKSFMQDRTDLLNFDSNNVINKVFFNKYDVTFSWTGQFLSNEMECLSSLQQSENFESFKKSLNNWGSPGLIFSYGDIYGNIGISAAAYSPIRDSINPMLPSPGWNEKYSWKGYTKLQNIYSIYNPAYNYVVAANNGIMRNPEIFQNYHWSSPSRAQRIINLLQEYVDYNIYYSARDAQIMQNDVLSLHSKSVLQQVLPILESNSKLFTWLELESLKILRNWDNICSALLIAPTIYHEFFERFINYTFADELGSSYKTFLSNSDLYSQKILDLLQEYDSHWFDDIKTKSVIETKDEIIIKSFKEAISNLVFMFRTEDLREWKYGLLHKLTLEHILSDKINLNESLNLGPFEMSGNNTTINLTDWYLPESFKVNASASMRFIADMSDSVMYVAVPGGISGQLLNANYSDQATLWAIGGYITLNTGRVPSEEFILRTIISPNSN